MIIGKLLVWVACLVPFAWTFLRAFGICGWNLGANPVEEVLHTMGKTGLNILLITLAVTPLRQLTGLNVLVRYRRLLGLFSFFYLMLHFLTYALLDLRLDWSRIFDDIAERPYITIGMLALVAMIPLAVTSTRGMQRRLGKRWVKLHRLIYPIAILGVLHFQWQTKGDLEPEPWVYVGILTLLLGWRVARRIKRARQVGRAVSQQ
ncbi:MAG: protein-methionine-sulfoxide reductase heme-binding subunit MsrQ [Gammaproteobacteria bacterium]